MFLLNRIPIIFISFFALAYTLFPYFPADAQTKTTRLSIATGGTGGVFYVVGGGIASLISKHLPGVEATAEVTAASVDNCKLIMIRKADLGFVLADTAYDAYAGIERFKGTGKVPLRALAVLYPAVSQIVTTEGAGIETARDLKGKRVSTGAPGSGAEVTAIKIFEALELDPAKDIRRERLSVAESASALKDRKIDAFFWGGGIPTAAVLDLASTPGIRIKLIAHDDLLEKINKKYGPSYYRLLVPKETYPGMTQPVPVIATANLLVCHEGLDEKTAHGIVKVILEHRGELIAIHKEADKITLENAVLGSSIPYHPGAIRYYTEKKTWPGRK